MVTPPRPEITVYTALIQHNLKNTPGVKYVLVCTT